MKFGRLPFRSSAYSVNWLTTSTRPPISLSDKFIFPSESSKIRICVTFSAIHCPLVRVVLVNSYECHEAMPDFGNGFLAHSDRCLTNPLYKNSHRGVLLHPFHQKNPRM